MKQTQQISRAGNVLFFILIGIFLLGGLTVLMSRTNSQSEDTGSSEQASIAASEILKNAASLESAISNLRSRGCGENQISFWNDSDGNGVEDASDDYYNPSAPSDRSCHVFFTQGAGLNIPKLKTSWLDSTYSASYLYGQNYYTGSARVLELADTSRSELIYYIQYIKKDICTALNRSLGVSVIPADNGVNNSSEYAARRFNGTYVSDQGLGDDGALADNGLIKGRKALCIQVKQNRPVIDTYIFYSTILPR